MTDFAIARYYDRLTRWNEMARRFGYGGGIEQLTAHRALANSQTGAAPSTTRLHELLGEVLSVPVEPRLLDAGCGCGGTMLDLTRRWNGCAIGLTLSPRQGALARAAIAAAGLAERIRVELHSYDDPPSGPFDVITAIESLAHSRAPAISVARLAECLAPNGSLVVVDDMPEPAAEATADLALFKQGWSCPVLWSRDAYLRAFSELGLQLTTDLDLTAENRPRPPATTRRLESLNRLVHRTIPSPGVRGVMDSHRGGLALERLLHAGLVRYRLLVARRAERV